MTKRMMTYLEAEKHSRFVDDNELERLKQRAMSSIKGKNELVLVNGVPYQPGLDMLTSLSTRKEVNRMN
jgi:hypothetical protein